MSDRAIHPPVLSARRCLSPTDILTAHLEHTVKTYIHRPQPPPVTKRPELGAAPRPKITAPSTADPGEEHDSTVQELKKIKNILVNTSKRAAAA